MFLTGLTAASSAYRNCIHIEATQKLMESFERQKNVTPSLARFTYSHDHTYQVRWMNFLLQNINILELLLTLILLLSTFFLLFLTHPNDFGLS